METKFNIAIATIGAILGHLLGGLDMLLIVFLTILVIDTCTGMIKAWGLREYSSKKFRAGFLKKTGYMIAVLVAVQIDLLLGNTGILRGACLYLFIANEGTSICENLGQMGVKLPPALIQGLEILKNKGESEK